MLGLPPTTPFARARLLLDYPIHDQASDYSQLPLPTSKTCRSTPPARPSRPETHSLEYHSPTPTRATAHSWMMTLDQAAELESKRQSGRKEDKEPSTPKTRPRSNSQTYGHPFSPVTPSRLSLPPITADNTDDFSPVSNHDSPYYPIYILPRRTTPELDKLARQKDEEIWKYAGPKPPKVRARQSLSELVFPVSRQSKRDENNVKQAETLADTVRGFVDKFPDVSRHIAKTNSTPKTRPRSFSFSALAEKYSTRSAIPGRDIDRTPSPPSRVTSSRRHPRSSPDSSPSTPSRTREETPSPPSIRTTPYHQALDYESLTTPKPLDTRSPKSSPMRRDSPERQMGSPHTPKTASGLGMSVFYGTSGSSTKDKPKASRPIAIPIPPRSASSSGSMRSDSSYPPMQTSGLTSPINALWMPYAMEASRQIKDASKPRDKKFHIMEVDDMVVVDPDEDGSDDEEMDDQNVTPPSTPGARFKVKLDGIEEGMWLSGTLAKDNHDREIDMFAESFKETDELPREGKAPLEMPSTPRPGKVAIPTLSKLDADPEQETNPVTMPAFLTPYAQREVLAKLPYNRSKEFVLAETRRRESKLVRPAPGEVRKRRKAPKEAVNLCVYTLQKNFSKAVKEADSPKPKVITPPVHDLALPEENWWGGRISPPGAQSPLEEYSEIRHIEMADDEDDDEDEDMEDHGLWAAQSQSHGLGLGLDLGIKLDLPLITRTSSSRPVPRPQRGFDTNPTSPPLARTPSSKGMPRSHSADDISALSPALLLPDGTKEGSMTPSPTTPEIVTPEFENESAERKVLAKEKYREGPGRTIAPMLSQGWGRRNATDDDDDDLPLIRRPTRKDKGKGKAPAPPPDAVEDDSQVMPSLTPDTMDSGEVDYEALAAAFGIDDIEEIMMQYALERSRQDSTRAPVQPDCGDSPGASTSRSPPSPSSSDVDMAENRSPLSIHSAIKSNSKRNNGPDGEAEWFRGWTLPIEESVAKAVSERERRSSTPSRYQDQDQVGPQTVDAGVDRETTKLMGALHLNEPSNDFSIFTTTNTPFDGAYDNDEHDDEQNDEYDEETEAKSPDSHVNTHDSNDITNSLHLTPTITLIPASPSSAQQPSAANSPSTPVLIRQVAAAQLGVPRVRKHKLSRNSDKGAPPFFRPPRPYRNQTGNSGVHFANRMYTKWRSLTASANAETQGARDGTGSSEMEGGRRPTKMRRVPKNMI